MNLMKTIKMATVAVSVATASVAMAEWKPKGPIKMYIGFGAGGTADLSARTVAKAIERNTGWRVISENRPGGSGIAMLTILSKKKPDGQTIGLAVNMPLVLGLALKGEKKMPINLNSIDYLGSTVVPPMGIVVKSDSAANNYKEFVEMAKTKTMKIGFSATPQKFVQTAVNKTTGSKVSFVPFKSTAESVASLLGGHIDASFGSGLHIQHLEKGTLKQIAHVNSDRKEYAPNILTLKEQGFNYALDPVFFIAAPKGMPADAKNALATAIDEALKDPEVIALTKKTFFSMPKNFGAEGTKAFIEKSYKTTKELVAGMK